MTSVDQPFQAATAGTACMFPGCESAAIASRFCSKHGQNGSEKGPVHTMAPDSRPINTTSTWAGEFGVQSSPTISPSGRPPQDNGGLSPRGDRGRILDLMGKASSMVSAGNSQAAPIPPPLSGWPTHPLRPTPASLARSRSSTPSTSEPIGASSSLNQTRHRRDQGRDDCTATNTGRKSFSTSRERSILDEITVRLSPDSEARQAELSRSRELSPFSQSMRAQPIPRGEDAQAVMGLYRRLLANSNQRQEAPPVVPNAHTHRAASGPIHHSIHQAKRPRPSAGGVSGSAKPDHTRSREFMNPPDPSNKRRKTTWRFFENPLVPTPKSAFGISPMEGQGRKRPPEVIDLTQESSPALSTPPPRPLQQPGVEIPRPANTLARNGSHTAPTSPASASTRPPGTHSHPARIGGNPSNHGVPAPLGGTPNLSWDHLPACDIKHAIPKGLYEKVCRMKWIQPPYSLAVRSCSEWLDRRHPPSAGAFSWQLFLDACGLSAWQIEAEKYVMKIPGFGKVRPIGSPKEWGSALQEAVNLFSSNHRAWCPDARPYLVLCPLEYARRTHGWNTSSQQPNGEASTPSTLPPRSSPSISGPQPQVSTSQVGIAPPRIVLQSNAPESHVLQGSSDPLPRLMSASDRSANTDNARFVSRGEPVPTTNAGIVPKPRAASAQTSREPRMMPAMAEWDSSAVSPQRDRVLLPKIVPSQQNTVETREIERTFEEDLWRRWWYATEGGIVPPPWPPNPKSAHRTEPPPPRVQRRDTGRDGNAPLQLNASTSQEPSAGAPEKAAWKLTKDASTQTTYTGDPPAVAKKPLTPPSRKSDPTDLEAAISAQSGVVSQSRPTSSRTDYAPQPRTPAEERTYLAVNPTVHGMHQRSKDWHEKKTSEIQSRGGRKAWFGRAADRERWLRNQAKAAKTSQVSTTSTRHDPVPWSHRKGIDIGDVAEADLPTEVLENEAWAKGCAWFRMNREQQLGASSQI